MTDERSLHPAHERNRIDMLHQSDVHYWCRTFDVSPAQLRSAVQQVGPQADAVRRYLAQRALPGAAPGG